MLRLVVSSLAASSQFGVDEIEDLSTAVSEICMKVGAYARSDSQLTVSLLPGDTFIAKVSAPCEPIYKLPPSSKANYFIKELVDDVCTVFEQGRELSIEIRLNRHSGD